MDRNIFRYILRHSLRAQLAILAMTVASFPFLYATLELPKLIINDALADPSAHQMFGFTFDQVSYLFVLCGLFLVLVLVNGGFKYVVNVYEGIVGERMLRRLRYELYSRMLRFPLPHFRRVSSGEIVQMINAEVEPLGGFIGSAFALPAFQGGTLLTVLAFMFVQNQDDHFWIDIDEGDPPGLELPSMALSWMLNSSILPRAKGTARQLPADVRCRSQASVRDPAGLGYDRFGRSMQDLVNALEEF
jgi:ABC-type multidrug transport system fused ATPase/permease subunit